MSAEAWIGRELDGRYIVEHVLGVGGMGSVLRARHKFTGGHVAIKLLKPEVQLDPGVQKRFLAEAQAPSRIGHRAIVQVIDAGRTADGLLYMVMELLTGQSLRVAMARRQLTPDQIARIVRELLDVLAHAHAKGFVHRDLKPDNVFLSAPNDDVRLLDFGIAKVLDDATRTANTVTGALLGTPAYMAPEQLQDARTVDARADLWAVGVIVYELISGRLPLAGRTVAQLLAALASGQVTPIRTYVPDASPQLEAFFARALAIDPRQRFASAAELGAALAAVPLPSTVAAAPTAPAASVVAPSAVPRAHPPTPGPLIPQTAAPRAHPPTPAPMTPTVASVAPRAHPPTPAPLIPLAHPPRPAPQPSPPSPAASSGNSTKLWIALIVGLGAIAILVIVLLARKTSPAKASIDAAVASTPSPEAGIAEPTDRDAAVVAVQIDCERDCAVVANRCGYGIRCKELCQTDQKARSCLARALDDCHAGALCGAEVLCGHPVATGTRSCIAVLQTSGEACAKRFGPTCGCAAMKELDPAYAWVFSQISTCIYQCGGVSKANEACIKICGNRYNDLCIGRP